MKAQEKNLGVAEMRMSVVTKLRKQGMKEIEGQRRWEKYPRKCRKIG